MGKNLLIIGAGIYGRVAGEIAESMGCFVRIDFVDDHAEETVGGDPVVGTTADLPALQGTYDSIVVAIGNPAVRAQMLAWIREKTELIPAVLVSPRAYVAPSAKLGPGCVVEPMAVVHTAAVLEEGCLISAGAVVNHAAHCAACVHVDCNAVVAGNMSVPAGTKVQSGTVFTGK